MVKQIETDVTTIDPVHPAGEVIERAAALLRQGELVVFPTETVYGLGADALQPAALEGIFAAKGRPFSDPLIVHIAELAALEELTSSIPVSVWLLPCVFWPGPLTLIQSRGWRVPHRATAGRETVAVRMPRHSVARPLISPLVIRTAPLSMPAVTICGTRAPRGRI